MGVHRWRLLRGPLWVCPAQCRQNGGGCGPRVSAAPRCALRGREQAERAARGLRAGGGQPGLGAGGGCGMLQGLGASTWAPGDRTSVPGLHTPPGAVRGRPLQAESSWAEAQPALRRPHCALFQVEAVGIDAAGEEGGSGRGASAGTGWGRDWGPRGRGCPQGVQRARPPRQRGRALGAEAQQWGGPPPAARSLPAPA